MAASLRDCSFRTPALQSQTRGRSAPRLRRFRMRASVLQLKGVPVPRPVPESGQPAAGLSPPGRRAPFPPNKGKAVARLLPAPRSGCLPLPLPSHTRSRQETRPEIPPDPRGGRQSAGLRPTFEPPQVLEIHNINIIPSVL